MRPVTFLLPLCVAVGTAHFAGCHAPGGDEPAADAAPAAPAASPLAWSGTTRTFAEEQAAADGMVAALAARVNAAPAVWIYREQLAGALLGRARLTGNWQDSAAARTHLDAAVALPNAVPWDTLASLQFSMHQFDALPATLDRVAGGFPQDTPREADVAGRRGNLALVRGEYAEARTLLERAVLLHGTPSARSSLAVWHWRTGDFETAESLYVQAAAGYHSPAAEPRAWFHLNLGLLDLDRGRWAEALGHYRDAERELSGFWLVDEHIAEVLVLLGETQEAERLYRDIITRTDAPEFMDALADLLAARGAKEEADHWRSEARRRWEGLLSEFPEAAYGHALAHYLDRGDAPERALELAVANHTLRPEGPSKVLLARALLALGRPAEARPLMEAALASPFRSAELHVVAAEVYGALGLEPLAVAQRAAARSIDPSAGDGL